MVDHAYGDRKMILYIDEKYGFYELFNERNGTLLRSDIHGKDPIMRSFPELLDVGVMGHCDHGELCSAAGIDCYQRGTIVQKPNMSISDFEAIVRQASGKTFQIALGGAGDPNKHPDFERLLKICRKYRIVPNITTSGFDLSDEEIKAIKEYCGAVAVSWYSRLVCGRESNTNSIETVNRLATHECNTNIHFVLSSDTLDEAIIRLQSNLFPPGVNAVVFLLYKPVGFGRPEKVIRASDIRLNSFFHAVLQKHPFRIGFDTCFTPAIASRGNVFSPISIDSCEAALFSMYIDSELKCYPCSFGIWNEPNPDSLKNKTIREVWNGEQFSKFRKKKKQKCVGCSVANICRFGCQLGLEIDVC